MNALRKLWRRFRPAPASVPVIAKPVEPQIPWGQILEYLNRHDEKEVERKPLKLPTVLPGVRPEAGKWPKNEGENGDLVLAMDSGSKEIAQDGAPSEPAAWGSLALNTGVIGPGLAFLGFPYLAELAQITEYRTPAETLSTEMTRTWLRLKNKGDDDKTEKIQQLTDRLEALKIRDLFREAALKTEQFGRAHIMPRIKGQDGDRARQLPLTEVSKSSLDGFACVEPYWLTPYSWNATEPEKPDFYRPQSWFVLGKKTHHTRVITFIFREVPDLLKPAYDFAGISITQLMMPYVNRWLRTAKNVNDLINIFSVVTLATDLQAMLQDTNYFMRRIQAFVQARDNRGMMMVNKGTEELSMSNVPLSSLDKLQAQAQEHMATPARMPLLKFFGITPSGLNATAEPELQNWYDYVHAMQRLGYDANFKRVLDIVQMDMFGEVDEDIVHEWLPLDEPTPKEASENRKADTDRDTSLITAGVVSPEEVRDKLKKDPTSGYDGLEGEAPEPPMMQEHQLGEEGKDNDAERDEQAAQNAHQRSEESADNAHERQQSVEPGGMQRSPKRPAK